MLAYFSKDVIFLHKINSTILGIKINPDWNIAQQLELHNSYLSAINSLIDLLCLTIKRNRRYFINDTMPFLAKSRKLQLIIIYLARSPSTLGILNLETCNLWKLNIWVILKKGFKTIGIIFHFSNCLGAINGCIFFSVCNIFK